MFGMFKQDSKDRSLNESKTDASVNACEDSLLVKLLEKRVRGFRSWKTSDAYSLSDVEGYFITVNFMPEPGYKAESTLWLCANGKQVRVVVIHSQDDDVLADLLNLCRYGDIKLVVPDAVDVFFNDDVIQVLDKGTTLEMLKVEFDLDVKRDA